MDAALAELRAAGCTSACPVGARHHERARRFYEAVGWQPDGAEKTDTFGDEALRELRYRRSLEDDA